MFEDHVEVGYNYRMTDIQAAVGIKQLEKLDWLVTERRRIVLIYNNAFKHLDFIQLPIEHQGYFSNYQSYAVYLKKTCAVDRNTIMQKLLDNGIASRRGVMNTHRETAYKNSSVNVCLPVSEDLQDNSILLPLYVPMTEKDIQYVINSFLEIISRKQNLKADSEVEMVKDLL